MQCYHVCLLSFICIILDTSADEIKKARAEAIQAAKDFLNPEKKTAGGSTSQSTTPDHVTTDTTSITAATESANQDSAPSMAAESSTTKQSEPTIPEHTEA